MPGILTHWLCAEKVADMMVERGNFKNIDKKSFFWGAQGPDIFFFNRFFPWHKKASLTNFGTRLHIEKPSVYFEVIAEILRKNSFLEQLTTSYALGIVCHYVLDRKAHPFVNAGKEYLSEIKEMPSNFSWHTEIETSLDIIMLRREKELLPTDIGLTSAIPADSNVQKAVAQFNKKMLRMRFGEVITDKQAYQLTTDMIKMFKILSDRLLIKKPIIAAAETICRQKGAFSSHFRSITEGDEFDYSNVLHGEWANPLIPNIVTNKSFFDLFDEAVTESCELIESFVKAVVMKESMADLTGELSFDNGIAVE